MKKNKNKNKNYMKCFNQSLLQILLINKHLHQGKIKIVYKRLIEKVFINKFN